MKLINILNILIFILFVCTGCDNHTISNTKNTLPKNHKATFDIIDVRSYNPRSLEEMNDLHRYYKEIIHDSFKQFMNDPQGYELSKMFKEHAFYSMPLGPKVTQTIFQKGKDIPTENPMSFEVVIMPEEFAKFYPSSALVNKRTMRIMATFKTKQWLAIIVLHEMTHIKDNLTVPFDPSPRPEVKAHIFENRLLKTWNPEGYAKMVEESKAILRPYNGDPLQLSKQDLQDLVKIAEKYYPLSITEVSFSERNLGTAACLIAMIFEHYPQKDEDSLLKAYIDFTKTVTKLR